MQQCIECGRSFAPNSTRQKFCSPNCRDRFKARKQRLERQAKGLCPQCGGPMDYPVRVGKGKEKPKISYCSKCREYYHRRHLERYEPRTDDGEANQG